MASRAVAGCSSSRARGRASFVRRYPNYLASIVADGLPGIFTWYILPDWPSTTKWLSPEEKFIAVQRLAADGIGNTGTGNQPTHSEAAKMAFTDWRTWVLVFMYMLATG